MYEQLDEQYLDWLYARIGSPRETRPTKSYWKLLRQLHETEFIFLIPNDDNRVEDGKILRHEFWDERELPGDPSDVWGDRGCSVLELLMGLAKRLAFEADRTPHYWFWELLHNLELAHCTDRGYNGAYVTEIVDTLIWRTYSSNGFGGLFPLRHPIEDQRDMEIWYQLNAYILERE